MVGGISCFAMGPSRLLGFGENLSLLLVGQGISGFAISLIFVPLLPELMEIVSQSEKIDEGTDEFNDKASGVYSFSFALGSLLAPVVGGFLDDAVGFRYMCDVMAFFTFAIGLIFFMTNIRNCKYRKTQQAKGVDTLKLLDNDKGKSLTPIPEEERQLFTSKSQNI
jgi:MFS family permease